VSNVVDRDVFRVFAFALYSEMNFATLAWLYSDANSAEVLLALLITVPNVDRSASVDTERCPFSDPDHLA
jgi:hypothetical protein